MNKREKYIETISGLPVRAGNGEIKKLLPEYFPHIPDLRKRAFFNDLLAGTPISIPSLMVKDVNLAVTLEDGYLRLIRPDEQLYEYAAYGEEAEVYARENWDRELILDPEGDQWIEAVKVYLQNPRNFAIEQAVYVVLSQPWQQIIYDRSEPRSQLVNGAIVAVFKEKPLLYEAIEAVHAFGATAFFHCSGCGSPLEGYSCDVCGASFIYDSEDLESILDSKQSMGCPLPPKLVKFINEGFEESYFVISPALQLQKEKEAWAASSC